MLNSITAGKTILLTEACGGDIGKPVFSATIIDGDAPMVCYAGEYDMGGNGLNSYPPVPVSTPPLGGWYVDWLNGQHINRGSDNHEEIMKYLMGTHVSSICQSIRASIVWGYEQGGFHDASSYYIPIDKEIIEDLINKGWKDSDIIIKMEALTMAS